MIEESFLLVNIHLSNLHFSPATPATSPALTIQVDPCAPCALLIAARHHVVNRPFIVES